MQQEVKEKIINRLRRIEGQIRAIQKMVEEEKVEQKQVLIQVSAATSSLENTKIALIEQYTKEKIMASIDSLSDMLK